WEREESEEDPRPAVQQQEQREQQQQVEPSPAGNMEDSDQSVQVSSNVNEEAWNRANEMLKLKRYEPARKVIKEQLKEANASARWKWKNLLAKSYQKHRKNRQDDKAELVLLRIRHRHRGTSSWPKAMIELGEISRTQGEFKRARQLLEKARRAYKQSNNPNLLLRLAELYDKHSGIRDYERAVKFYRQFANRVASSKPKKAKTARKRAEYLEKNYVKFGTQ
ncbi:MAG: tol-pal system YbgF family protein, partial [bacterium]